MKKIEEPLVSIVIPCYNHERFVQESIQSVINQSYKNIELIVIDDGSTDNSVLKIKELSVECIQRFTNFEFRSRPNKGLSSTLNEAIEWCKGEYYSAIASDDVMFKYKTKRQIEILIEKPEIVGIFGAVQMINADGELLNKVKQSEKVIEFNDLIYTDRFLPAPTQMLRLNALKETGGFVDGMVIEDWYIYLKLLENGEKILYKDEIYCYYRIHEGNTSSNQYSMGLGYLQVLDKFKKQDLFKKAYIKVCWEISLATLRSDFKLSIKILIERIFHKFKILLKKIMVK